MSRSTPQAAGFPVGTANVPVAAPTTVEYALLPDELAESFVYQAAHNDGLSKVLCQNRVRANLGLLMFMVLPPFLAVSLEMGMDDSGWSLLRAACVGAGSWCLVQFLHYLSRLLRQPLHIEAQRRMYRRAGQGGVVCATARPIPARADVAVREPGGTEPRGAGSMGRRERDRRRAGCDVFRSRRFGANGGSETGLRRRRELLGFCPAGAGIQSHRRRNGRTSLNAHFHPRYPRNPRFLSVFQEKWDRGLRGLTRMGGRLSCSLLGLLRVLASSR